VAARRGVGGLRRAAGPRDADQPVHGDRRQHERGDDADLALVAREHRADRAAGDGRHGRIAEIRRRDAHAGRHTDARAAGHGGLDQQQADGAHLHRDG
jgi:hypothetical protein